MSTSRARRGALLVLLTSALLVGGGCSLKWTFIQLSYPNPSDAAAGVRGVDPDASSDLAFTTYTSLMPVLLTDYRNPPAVGQCLAALAGEAELRRVIRDYGVARATAPPADWYAPDDRLTVLDPLWSPWPEACPVASLGDDDQARLVAALASSGEVMVQTLLGSSGGLRPSVAHLRPRVEALDRGLSDALATSARLLGADPAGAWGGSTDRGAYPSLVLSGGAGNGAFAAGYVYQLLRLREEALRLSVYTQPGVHQRLREDARFGAIASTSVGALIAVAVDLYYADLGPAAYPADTPWGATRDQQEQALRLLRDGFIVDEWDLFRVCRGNVFSLITVPDDPVPWTPQAAVLRFDPLIDTVLAPLFTDHGDALLANDVIRVTTAIEADNNGMAFLDERACRLLAGEVRQECLVSAVKASISEPALAPPVPRVYSGLSYVGEEGTWLDGGLRSGAPASMGASYNGEWGRVLAINTHRYQGVPAEGFDNAVQLVERTISTFTEQTRSWELAYAQLHDEARHAARCRAEAHLGLTNRRDRECILGDAPSPLQMAARAHPPAPQHASWLRTVYVPDDVDMELSTSGYAFDSQVLEGLWLEGRRAFLTTSDDVTRWLGPGWNQLGTSDPGRGGIPGYREFVAGERAAVEAAWTAWEVGWYATSAEERARVHRQRLQQNLRSCVCEQDSCRRP